MTAFRLALLLALSSIPATAQEQQQAPMQGSMGVGRGVTCETLQQAERFATLRSDGKEADVALRTVNTEASGACSFGLVMFTGGAPVAQLAVNGRPVTVVEIIVHAFNYGAAWKEVPEVIRYTVVVEKGLIA